MFISQEGKKIKMKETVKGAIPLNYLEVTSTRGGGASNNGGKYNKGYPPLSLNLRDQKQQSMIRAQIPNICRMGSFLPILAPQAMCKLLLEPMCGCLELDWE